jgi:acyl-phosphate glycerol 3-phosphate acyltransferase
MGTTVLLCFLPIVIGYLLGSVLPGYLLPLWMKNVDIRTLGDGNPGTINVKRSIGLSLALVIAAYDLTKGLISMLIAYRLFNAPTYVVALSGFAAILGHKFPFYLKFRGGRGIATTVGIFIFLLAEVTAESMPVHDVIAALCYMGAYAILIMAATHDDDFLAITLLPIAGGILAFYVRSFSELTLVITLIGIISYEGSKNLRRKMFVLANDKPTLWRIFARSLAILVVFLGLFISKKDVLLVVGSFLFLFFAIDVFRIAIPRLETVLHGEVLKDVRLLREREEGKISSYTIFLLGIFLSLLLFRPPVTYATLGFLSIGGMSAKIVEINYGKTRLFKKSKTTLQASLAFLAACLTVAYFLWIANILPLWIGLIGACVATLVEILPSQLDDNLSVPLVSGAIMEFVLRLIT